MDKKMPIAAKLVKNGESLPEIVVECESTLEIEKKLKDKISKTEILIVNLNYPIACHRVWFSSGIATKYDFNYNVLGSYTIFTRVFTGIEKVFASIQQKKNYNYSIPVSIVPLKKNPQKCEVKFILIKN